jgi:hypothetical protein
MEGKVFTSVEIRALLLAMDASKVRHAALKAAGQTEAYYEAVAADCPELFEEFPSIFDPHIKDALPGEIGYLLDQLGRVEAGTQTVQAADEAIGKKMAQDYVYPLLKNEAPTSLSYADYLKQQQAKPKPKRR